MGNLSTTLEIYLNQRLNLFAISIVIFGTCCTSTAFAQQPAAEPKADAKPAAKTEEKKKDPKTEEFEKAIKDLPKYEGALTLYVKKKDILLELPEAMLGKVLYAQAAIHSGGSTNAQFGLPVGIGDTIDSFTFRKFGDDRIHLVRPNTKFRWNEKDPWANASKLAFPEAILSDFRIEVADTANKRILLNISSLFSGDLFRLNEFMGFALGGTYLPDREKSGIDKVFGNKQFTTVRMNQHYMAGRGGGGIADILAQFLGGGSSNLEDSRSAPVKITYTLYWQPETNYRPRLADARIGYFTQDFTNIGQRYMENDKTTRYITRWNFRGKKDPKAELSEPNNPMVWVLDSTIPADWRESVRRAVLSWNKAFERVGYKNALQVIDPPKDDPNYDHADSRYNVIRFPITNGYDGAIALFRTDPMTGEILNASINSDMSWIYLGKREHDRQVIPSNRAREVGKFLATAPAECDHDHSHGIAETVTGGRKAFDYLWGFKTPEADVLAAARKQFGFTNTQCEYESQLVQRAQRDIAFLQSSGRMVDLKTYTEELVSHVIAHEMGHCLGLRHNFVASTSHDLTDLANVELLDAEGISTSLMDYTPSNNVAILNGKGRFYTWDPGLYDTLAIEYGYAPVTAASPEGEKSSLSKIAAKTARKGYEYMTDDDADGIDPFVRRFDLGRDPVAYAGTELEVARKQRTFALNRLNRPGASLAERNDLLLASYTNTFGALAAIQPFFGGVQTSRAFVGDGLGRNTLRPVDPAVQRAALQLICREGLSMEVVDLPESVLQSMNKSYDGDANSGYEAPLRSILGGQLIGLVSSSLSAYIGDQILENEFKTKNTKPYTLTEHYGGIIGKVYSEVGTKPSISPLRRDLQQFTVDLLLEQATSDAISSDIRAVATSTLSRLRTRFVGAMNGSDDMTRTHLGDMVSRMDRMMNRIRVEGNFGGSAADSGLPFDFFGRKPR